MSEACEDLEIKKPRQRGFFFASARLVPGKLAQAACPLALTALLPITRSLPGILKPDREDEYKQAYHNYLEEKYR